MRPFVASSIRVIAFLQTGRFNARIRFLDSRADRQNRENSSGAGYNVLMPAATLVVVLGALFQAAPATSPSTATAPTIAERKAAFFQATIDAPDDTHQAPKSIHDYVRIDLVDGFITITAAAGDMAGKTALRFSDVPGRAVVTISESKGALSLQLVSTALVDEVGSSSFILKAPDYVQLSRDTELPGGLRTVSLVQQPLARDEDPVRLFINESDEAATEPRVKLKLTAGSFRELQLKYPTETRQYLGPLLRDFDATAVLSSASRTAAWQVLGSEAAEDPAETQTIREIVKRLGSEEFIDREAALVDLQNIGPPAASRLVLMGTADLAPEPRTAVDAFIARQRPIADADAERLRRDGNFLLDALALNDPRLNPVALARLAALHVSAPELNAIDTARDRDAAMEALRRSLPRPTTVRTTETN